MNKTFDERITELEVKVARLEQSIQDISELILQQVKINQSITKILCDEASD